MVVSSFLSSCLLYYVCRHYVFTINLLIVDPLEILVCSPCTKERPIWSLVERWSIGKHTIFLFLYWLWYCFFLRIGTLLFLKMDKKGLKTVFSLVWMLHHYYFSFLISILYLLSRECQQNYGSLDIKVTKRVMPNQMNKVPYQFIKYQFNQ